MMMKFKHLFFGTLLAALISACSDDMAGVKEPDKILESETTTFIRLSIMGDNGATRAGEEYENGSGDESAIKSILMTFFDGDKKYVGKTLVNVNEDQDNVEFPDSELDNTVERLLSVVASVTLPQNMSYPKYVVAYVNPTSASADLVTDYLDDALKVIRNRTEVSPQGYRTMNNSMYFKDTDICYATEVDFENQFFKTKEELENAEKEGKNAAIEITIERMEAKVRLNTPLGDMQPKPVKGNYSEGNSEYSLQFVPEAWFVNGTEKRSFLLKNYRTERENFTNDITGEIEPYKLDALNQAFTGRPSGFTINDSPNKRSYWAIDPTYFYEVPEDVYPDVSYDVLYGEINTEKGHKYPLEYRSYTNAIKEYKEAKSNSYVKFNGTAKTHEYVLENTMSSTTLRSTDAKASMTSVVLLGHYVVTATNGDVKFDGSELNKNTAFYVRHEDEGNNKIIVMLTDDEAKDFFLELNTDLFYVQNTTEEGTPTDEYVPLRAAHLKNNQLYGISHDDFELVYPDKSMSPDKIESEQWRTLDVKTSDRIYIVAGTEETTGALTYKSLKDLTEGELAALKIKMYSAFGLIEKFQSGKAYFNVPLKHIWASVSTSNEFKAETVKLGDYGVVRNHIYDLAINKIEGLGTGIGDVDQPIVPPTENELYYIKTKLNILKWRLVKQSVDL